MDGVGVTGVSDVPWDGGGCGILCAGVLWQQQGGGSGGAAHHATDLLGMPLWVPSEGIHFFFGIKEVKRKDLVACLWDYSTHWMHCVVAAIESLCAYFFTSILAVMCTKLMSSFQTGFHLVFYERKFENDIVNKLNKFSSYGLRCTLRNNAIYVMFTFHHWLGLPQPCLRSSDNFLSFLSLFLSFSSSSDLAWFMRECLTGVWLLCMDTLSCIHGVADDIGSRPAAWSYVPIESYSCSLCVFQMILEVGNDTLNL